VSLNPFSKRKKKKLKLPEKGHREPIMVKFFKEKDPDRKMHVSIDDAKGENSEGNDIGENGDETAKKHARFIPNDKYFTVSIYALMAVMGAILFAVIIINIGPVLEGVKRFLSVLSPFIIGGIIAFILTPVVNMLDESFFEKVCKIKKPKIRAGLSIALTYIIFLGLIVLAMVKLVPDMGSSIKELYGKAYEFLEENVPEIVGRDSEEAASDSSAEAQDQAGTKDENGQENIVGQALVNSGILKSEKSKISGLFKKVSGIVEKIQGMNPELFENIGEYLIKYIPSIFSTSYSIVHSIINILLAVAVSIYMVCDKRRIAYASTKMVYCIMKPKKAEKFIENAKESFQIFTGFIIGKAIDSLIIGILTFFILKIFGLPYQLLVAVIVGVTNMIPFFGPFIGAIPGVILYLCIDPVFALIFVIIILAIQQFDGWILGPMILGDSTGIRPIWVIFGITVGGAYFGFAGMFLGVPFTAVVVYLVNKAVDKKLNDKHIEVS